MGGGGSKDNTDYGKVAYNNALSALRGGQTMAEVNGSQPRYQASNDSALSAFERENEFANLMSKMSSPQESTNSNDRGPAYDPAAAMREAEDRRARVDSVRERDTLLSSRSAAENEATLHINSQIDKQISNARLIGSEFNVSEQQRSEQIDNYFGGIWTEQMQSSLESVMDKVGSPSGWSGWRINRGTGEAGTKKKSGEDVVSKTFGVGGVQSPTESGSDQLLSGQQSILGA